MKVRVRMETKRKKESNNNDSHGVRRELPIYRESCNFEGYNPSSLIAETAKLRNLITKRGTLEILIPLCCSTEPVRYKKFRDTMKGISSKTLACRLQELEKGGILERRSYNEIPPRVEYNQPTKGQELVESIIGAQQNHKTVLKNQKTKWPLLNNPLCFSLSIHQEISVNFVVGMSKEILCIEIINKQPINN